MSTSFKSIRSSFPIFGKHPELIYLDNAATSQKPQVVIDTLNTFYTSENATIHRGLYPLSSTATRRYEEVRKKVSNLIGSPSPNSIAFTKGTTESINLVAQKFLKKKLDQGDNVVVSAMEHHANLIPWQQVCVESQANLKIIPIDERGDIIMDEFVHLLDRHTRMVAITHISNAIGTVNPVEEIIATAHKKNIPVLVDGAQSVGHCPVDVSKWDADFLVFSAHKMFGPFGTGVLYCNEEFAQQIDPLNYGGGGIKNVEYSGTEFSEYPHKLEAGTANVAGVIGLGSAIDFIEQLDLNETKNYTKNLVLFFKEKLSQLEYIKLIGQPSHFGGIVSFVVENIHPHDVASFLANKNIAVRAGHHCAQPLLESMGIPATVRASFSIYNTRDEVDCTFEALVELKKFWS